MSKVWLQRRGGAGCVGCHLSKGVNSDPCRIGDNHVCSNISCYKEDKIFIQVVPKRLLRKKGCLNCEYNQPDLWCAKTKAFGPDCGYEPKQGYSLIGG